MVHRYRQMMYSTDCTHSFTGDVNPATKESTHLTRILCISSGYFLLFPGLHCELVYSYNLVHTMQSKTCSAAGISDNLQRSRHRLTRDPPPLLFIHANDVSSYIEIQFIVCSCAVYLYECVPCSGYTVRRAAD